MSLELEELMDAEQAFFDEMTTAGLAWQKVEGWTRSDGTIYVRWSTNDDRDLGYPTECAENEHTVRNRMDFDRIYGVSRTGCLGTKVDVYLDGQKLF